uniref:Major facilitator superfamily (MFS) profile domain-containing protein n=1 Tax=Brassica campestris TaxID=3711 RepID=M4FCN9_BRACM
MSNASDDSREPLVEKHVAESKQEQPWMVYLSTFVAVCGSFAFGSCAGYSSPAQAAIRNDLSLTIAEFSLFGSLLTFGAMFGAITSGPIADSIGRKGAMRVSSAFCVAGWLAIFFAKGVVALDLGRLATGYGMGAFSYVVPIFIAEIAPKAFRGALTTLNQILICTGVSVSFIIGTMVTWRVLALIVSKMAGKSLRSIMAKMGRDTEFEAALRKLRGKKADVSEEAAEIQDYIETLERLPKAKALDLFQRRYIRSVLIAFGLMVFQQFGGINGICFYTSSIFEQAGFPTRLGMIIYAVLQVVITALNAPIVDRAGRKPLLLVSATGLVIGCLITAVSFYLKAHDMAHEAVPVLAVVGIMMYIASFSAGMGAMPWVVMSEIFPINIKGVAGGMATLVNWFGAWAVSYTFNFLMSWSSYGTFIIYAVINALAIVFVIAVVPETKGKTLEEIQAVVNP